MIKDDALFDVFAKKRLSEIYGNFDFEDVKLSKVDCKSRALSELGFKLKKYVDKGKGEWPEEEHYKSDFDSLSFLELVKKVEAHGYKLSYVKPEAGLPYWAITSGEEMIIKMIPWFQIIDFYSPIRKSDADLFGLFYRSLKK